MPDRALHESSTSHEGGTDGDHNLVDLSDASWSSAAIRRRAGRRASWELRSTSSDGDLGVVEVIGASESLGRFGGRAGVADGDHGRGRADDFRGRGGWAVQVAALRKGHFAACGRRRVEDLIGGGALSHGNLKNVSCGWKQRDLVLLTVTSDAREHR